MGFRIEPCHRFLIATVSSIGTLALHWKYIPDGFRIAAEGKLRTAQHGMDV